MTNTIADKIIREAIPGLEKCPNCGAMTILADHAPESCALGQKFRAEKVALIEAGLWDNNDELAVRRFLKKWDADH